MAYQEVAEEAPIEIVEKLIKKVLGDSVKKPTKEKPPE